MDEHRQLIGICFQKDSLQYVAKLINSAEYLHYAIHLLHRHVDVAVLVLEISIQQPFIDGVLVAVVKVFFSVLLEMPKF